MTLELGDPAEVVELPPRGIAVVEPGTPLLVQNRSDEQVIVFVYGAPAVRDAEIIETMW